MNSNFMRSFLVNISSKVEHVNLEKHQVDVMFVKEGVWFRESSDILRPPPNLGSYLPCSVQHSRSSSCIISPPVIMFFGVVAL